MTPSLTALLWLAMATPADAPASDILLADRAQAPALHGLTGAQVQARLGAPLRRLEPRGGQKPQWPTIQRWVYPHFTLYLEHDRVIEAVADRHPAP